MNEIFIKFIIFQVYHLKQHCKTLEGELDDVKSEIVRIISEKEVFFKENGTLKDYKKAFEDLKEENSQLRKERQNLNAENKYLKSPNASQDKNIQEILDRSSPDGEEVESVLQKSVFISQLHKEDELLILKKEIKHKNEAQEHIR